jgi:hypothetical protein
MPLAGLVVNRMYRVSAPGLSAARALGAAEELDDEDSGGPSGDASPRDPERTPITQGLLRMHAIQAEIAARHESLAKRFVAGHPGIPMVEVPAASGDIHDLVGLRLVGNALAGN